jgi:hypothetical protein
MKKLTLRTYNKLWKMPFKIYSIDNLKLIVPINPWNILVFGIALVFILLLSKILFFIKIPFIFKYAIFPWAVTKIADTVKLDGKKPYKYFFDMARFSLNPKCYERFKPLSIDNLKGFKEKFIVKKKTKINYKNKHEYFMNNINTLKK